MRQAPNDRPRRMPWRSGVVIAFLAVVAIGGCSDDEGPGFTVAKVEETGAQTTYRLTFSDRSTRQKAYVVELKSDGIWEGIGTAVPAQKARAASYSSSVPEGTRDTTAASDLIVLPSDLPSSPTRVCVEFEADRVCKGLPD